MEIFEKAAELINKHVPFAICTIIRSAGSTPRTRAKMLVTKDSEIIGTIGGGLAEAFIIQEAIKRIETEDSGIVTYRLDNSNNKNSIDMLCGGDLDIFIEIHNPGTRLVLIGGGHVNLQIAKAAHAIGFIIDIVETRQEFATFDRFPMARNLFVDTDIIKALELAQINPQTFSFIATHNHDDNPLRFLLQIFPAYIGMLGSRRKVFLIKQKFLNEGIKAEILQKIHAPAGLDLGAETPEEIAVSVVSEMLMIKNRSKGIPLSQKAENLIVMRGAVDIATGTIVRLHNSGFGILALEIEKPTVIRKSVAFAEAVFSGNMSLEGVNATLAHSIADAKSIMDKGHVAVFVDPEGASINSFQPRIVIDAILAKKNLGTHMGMAPLTIGLGPGFIAGKDVSCVIETNRGHNLGKVYWEGAAEKNTGIPGLIEGVGIERVIRAPIEGKFNGLKNIGDHVEKHEIIGYVENCEIYASISGVIRVMLQSGLKVTRNFKIADIDPRDCYDNCWTISDKARAVAGGVLEAVMQFIQG